MSALHWPPYVELRAHTCFSFSDGAVSAEALAAWARRYGYSHLGLTDTADLGGLARFAVAAMAPLPDPDCPDAARHGADDCPACQRPVQPIAGAELVVDGCPAAFLARTPEGYQNLAALVTLARVGQWENWNKTIQGKQRGRPRVTWAQVAGHARGLHALTGPASGRLASLVRAGRMHDARRCLARWRDVFGEERRLAVEVQLHHTGGHDAALAAELIQLAEDAGVPWVATQDPRYVDDRGRLVHDLLTALRYDLDVETAAERGVLHPNGEWRLLSPEAMAARWHGRDAGLRESVRIADECTGFTLDWMRPPLPDFRRTKIGAAQELDDDAVLRQWTADGARERWGTSLTPAQEKQINHELTVISTLGFAGFFLVMAEAVTFARGTNILCQGRGSAANSAVAYCLGITAVDPVANGLLFERFLSEARVNGKTDAPDIDVDFEHERREEVLNHMYEQYERRHAALTAVTQIYRAPNAVLDAMRALGYPPDTALELSKRVHGTEPAECIDRVIALAERRQLSLNDARGRALLEALPGFDGLARLRSTHVGGFVLSAGPLGHWLPVEQTSMGRTIVQFDKDDLDMIGVPKFDFLGLGALTMVRKAFDVVEQSGAPRPELYNIPDRDERTYDLIRRGETIGMFQIESRAQINSILHTKPDHLYDLVVQVALIRPGPIQAKFVHPYTQRRLELEDVTYAHPGLETILKRTQGIPIFQEQAMAIAQALGGYSGAEADLLRRTMGNVRKEPKLRAALSVLEQRMLERSAARAIDPLAPDVAKRICEDLISFSNYGFPESHAWSFALIAYITAYLKAHHPAAFYIGLLNAQPMGFYPVSTVIHDAKRHGVTVRPPCVATGSADCTLEGLEELERLEGDGADPSVTGAMRVGWRFVRGLSSRACKALATKRAEAPFESITDAITRAHLAGGDALALARAGAFDAWLPDRRHAAWEALRACGDVLPFAPAAVTRHDPAPLTREDLVFLDYDTVGMSAYGHPMAMVRDTLRLRGAVDSRALADVPSGRIVTVTGLVTVRQRPATAKGTIFLLLEDEYGYINVVVPQPLVEPNENVVKEAPFVAVQGRVENDGVAISVVGRKFTALLVRALTHQAHAFH